MKQKPMSLIQFQKKFSPEEAYQKHLFHIRWPNGYHCPRCDHDQVPLTAETIFHKTITSLVKWFWLIFLKGRQEGGISIEIGSYKTVWTMGHKIRKAMCKRFAQYKLAEVMEIIDTYFGSPKQNYRSYHVKKEDLL